MFAFLSCQRGVGVRAFGGALCSKKVFVSNYTTAAPTEGLTIVPTVLVHGGSTDNTPDELRWNLKNSVMLAARFGYEELNATSNVLDAVKIAVARMESDPILNAGYGSALTWDGTIEMDAALMRGSDLEAGCVSLVHNIANPIRLAKIVMDKTRHTYMAGESAMKLAWDNNFPRLKDNDLLTARTIEDLKKLKEKVKEKAASPDQTEIGSTGTVGAVAIDEHGNVAAATSTGGITGKLPGRIGDSAILGSSTYADNEIGALSVTGHGESIMRFNVASRILACMQYLKCTPQDAAQKILDELAKRFQRTAGVIVINSIGQVGISFTAQRMPWAYKRGRELHCGIDKGEDEMQMLKN